MAKTKRPVGRQPPGGASKNEGQEPVGPANEYLVFSWNFIAMAGICLDRLLGSAPRCVGRVIPSIFRRGYAAD
jgi:hypothetical protein